MPFYRHIGLLRGPIGERETGQVPTLLDIVKVDEVKVDAARALRAATSPATSPMAGVISVVAAGLFAVLPAFSPALAQSTDLSDAIEVTGEISAVAGSSDGDISADVNARLKAKGSAVLDNGLELGAVASLRADGDAVGRRYAGGRYSSLLSGGTRGDDGDSGDVFLEGAYLFARGGFGSLHIGRDAGVASRLSLTSPSIFRAVGVNDWETDLTGLNDVHTINDFSGQATKVTYMPPTGLFGGAIGQLQVGLSYAPELGDCGDDRCAPLGEFAVDADGNVVAPDQNWRDVLETAVYYENGIDVGEEPLTFGFSASYVRADENAPMAETFQSLQPLFGDYRAYAFGMNVAIGNLTIGGSLKTTNAGLNEDRDEDYLAFDAGVTYEAGEWNFMLGYGAADTARDAVLLVAPDADVPFAFDQLDRETQTAQAGISYVFDHGVTLGAAAQFVDSEKDVTLGGPEEATALMFESSIKF